MKINKILPAILVGALSSGFAFTTLSAQEAEIALPVSDAEMVGEGLYSSPTFGSWQIDATTDNRIIHDILGPLVWSTDEETGLTTLSTERWGALQTTFVVIEEGEERPTSTDGLAIVQNFPVTWSTLEQGYFSIDISGENENPFFNHSKDDEGVPFGYQNYIGVALNDAPGYFNNAVSSISDMGEALDNIYRYFAILSVQSAYIGNTEIENYFNKTVEAFEELHQSYTEFVYYYHRTVLSAHWVEQMGGTEEDIADANLYIQQLPQIEQEAHDIYGAAQIVRFEQAEPLKDLLLSYIEELEKYAGQNTGGSSGGSSGGSGYVPPSNSGSNTTPIVVDGDAINWSNVDQVGSTANQGIETFNVSAQLSAVNPHIGSYYGPTGWYLGLVISGTQNWQSYDPYGTGGLITGNIWIFVPQGNGRYWAAVFEGYGNFATNFPAGNLNFEHHNILAGTPMASPWQPQSGVEYGWMVSTNLIYPGRNGDQRTNIIIQAWP